MRRLLPRVLAAIGAAVLLPACIMVGPDYVAPTPAELRVPPAWNGPAPTGGSGADVASWWRALGDPRLTDLIARATHANLDVQGALARLHEARARRSLAAANLWPTLSASAAPQYLQTSAESGIGNSQDLYNAGFDASWEVDLVGGQRRALEGATGDLEASEASLHETLVTVAAEVARNYIELRSFQARIAIVEANLARQSETLALTEWRVQAGLTSSLDAEQARTNVEQTRATIPTLQTGKSEAQHRLAMLLGLAPAALTDELDAAVPIPEIPMPLTIGIPADILRQRPDVAAAERTLAAETARIGEATAARYPSLQLSGSIGMEALTVGALTSGSAFAAGVAANLVQTIFDGGRITAQIDVRDAVQEQAYAAYRAAVLRALEDVENALVLYANTGARAHALRDACESAQNASLLARHRYTAGITDFQTVLDTERTILTIEENLNATQATNTAAIIQLYKALGGGWTSAASGEAATRTSG